MKKPKILRKKKLKEPDYDKLGRLLYSFSEANTYNKNRIYKMAFFKGIATGLGSVIGATIVLSILLWFITLLGDVPFLSDIVNKVETTIESN